MFDVAIIGAGPGGLSAATLLGAEGKSVLLLERENQIGGQLGNSALVENLLGWGDGITGEHLRQESLKQIDKFGVRLVTGYPVVQVEKVAESSARGLDTFMLNQHFFSRSLLLATGLAPKPVGIDLYGDCSVQITPRLIDGIQHDEHVLVVGGGNGAAQAALYYRRLGARVALLSHVAIAETMDADYVKRLRSEEVVVHIGTLLSITSEDGWALVTIHTGTERCAYYQHVHFLIGGVPDTGWLPTSIARDGHGLILADKHHQTTLPGCFAIGDCVADSTRRASCAIGSAGSAARYITVYLKIVRERGVVGV